MAERERLLAIRRIEGSMRHIAGLISREHELPEQFFILIYDEISQRSFWTAAEQTESDGKPTITLDILAPLVTSRHTPDWIAETLVAKYPDAPLLCDQQSYNAFIEHPNVSVLLEDSDSMFVGTKAGILQVYTPKNQ